MPDLLGHEWLNPQKAWATDSKVAAYLTEKYPDAKFAVVEEALKGFEAAGATVKRVKLGIRRSQRELSDLWCRLMMPLNITGLLGMKAAGYDLLGQHRGDFPPEYLCWIDQCMDMTA